MPLLDKSQPPLESLNLLLLQKYYLQKVSALDLNPSGGMLKQNLIKHYFEPNHIMLQTNHQIP